MNRDEINIHPDVLKARFEARVQRTETCWFWTGSGTRDGYGRITVGQRALAAHRFAYELFVGPIGEGLQVDHLCHGWDATCAGGITCRHRACVNPKHLEAVTPQVNNLRGLGPAAERAKRTHCPKGHPYDEANTIYLEPGMRRSCRICRKAYEARRQASGMRMHVPLPVLRMVRNSFPGEPPAAVLERAVREYIANHTA
ncbi:HNH endonuclease [Streptomyces gardneri]|uniref:HNH endonuclease n=1 Tax=Streptomyces gardneri TaxID=66892 RepID=UPI0033D36148